MNIRLYQIVYDAQTESRLGEGFLALRKPDGNDGWFEFSPIVAFLEDEVLDQDTWYGFLSPRFTEKTGQTAESVSQLLRANPSAEVALFSPYWFQLALWQNPWLQGDSHHPGTLQKSQEFAEALGYDVDLSQIVTDFSTSVFSNYVVARPRFWRVWKDVASHYREFAAHHSHDEPTHYKGSAHPSHVFIQERLSSLILAHHSFDVVHMDYIARGLIEKSPRGPLARQLLRLCDYAKAEVRAGRKWKWALFTTSRASVRAMMSLKSNLNRLLRTVKRTVQQG